MRGFNPVQFDPVKLWSARGNRVVLKEQLLGKKEYRRNHENC